MLKKEVIFIDPQIRCLRGFDGDDDEVRGSCARRLILEEAREHSDGDFCC